VPEAWKLVEGEVLTGAGFQLGWNRGANGVDGYLQN